MYIIRIILFAVALALFQSALYSQEDSVEIFLIDSFVTPETPNTFILSFYTSEPAKSRVIIDHTHEITVSEELTEQHKAEIPVEEFRLRNKVTPFVILAEDSSGKISTSEIYEFEMPYEPEVQGGSNILTLCIFGGTIFLLPAPAYVITENENYFSLNKEIPIIFFRSAGIGYPRGYFSVEYSHIFNAPSKNFFRTGYKQLISIPGIEYISPGINGFTDFRGFNGISPEISLGLFRISNIFTVYSRYRYNFKPGESGSNFSEFSIGLYSGFFALYF